MLCDKKGNRCYTSGNELSLAISGPAHLAGTNRITVAAGLARVAVRSNGESGEISISVSGKNIPNEEITLKTLEE